jgi:hypothetical protein
MANLTLAAAKAPIAGTSQLAYIPFNLGNLVNKASTTSWDLFGSWHPWTATRLISGYFAFNRATNPPYR